MSAPPPPEGYAQYPGYGAEQVPDPQGTPQPVDAGAAAAPGKKKKRGYAAGAFEVASGANAAGASPASAAGVPPQFGAPVPGQVPAYGYPQAVDPAAAPVPGAQPGAYQYPGQAPQAQPAYGGYPAPDQGYPGAAVPAGVPGVGGITQGMGGMNLGGQPLQQPVQPAQAAAAPRAVMNQLYATDLINQPVAAAELDLPPPPITLPPNVSLTADT